jgi:cysteine synthase
MVERISGRCLLKPTITIVEPTLGNTGLALAMVATVLSYKAVFTVLDKVVPEKIVALKALGSGCV